MKKILVILLTLLVLTGCSGSDGRTASNEKMLTQEEFKQCFTIVPITTDNWQDYFYLDEYVDPDGVKCLVCYFKDEKLDNLCGKPEVKFSWNVELHRRNGTYDNDSKTYIDIWDDLDSETQTETLVRVKSQPSGDKYYFQSYLVITDEFYSYNDSSFYGCDAGSKTENEVYSANPIAISGQLCYANYPEDNWNTNKYDEKYVCFENDKGVKYSVFDNGLVRWDKGSGFGYYQYGDDIYSCSYYDFFEE